MDSSQEMHKRIVREFYEMAFNQKKPEEAAARYLVKTYRQHNPLFADGPLAFVAAVNGWVSANPTLHFDFKRLICEGDLVVVHSHLTMSTEDRGRAVMDIFRLEDGQMA